MPRTVIASACRSLAALLAIVLLSGATTTPPPPAPALVIRNVNVIPMDRERVLDAHTVVIDGGRIVALGPADQIKPPADATVIDGDNQFLLPGLYELHAHVPVDEASTDRVLTLFLANGVTTVRGMLGAPGHLPLREALASGARQGPRLITSGPSFNGNTVASPEQATRMVREQHAAGYDFIKLHPGLRAGQYAAIVTTARELGMPFAGHVSADVGLTRTLAARQDSIDHLDGYLPRLVREGVDVSGRDPGFFHMALADVLDRSKIAPLAQRTAAAGVWNVPTQTLIENLASPATGEQMSRQPAMRYMPPATVARWAQVKDAALRAADYQARRAKRGVATRRALIKALHDAGAGLLLGSDAPQIFNVPGFATHEELALMVECGLTPFAALATGTVNPARFFKEADARGQVGVGYAADLLLLSANPLENIRHSQQIAGVVRQGQWLGRADLDAMLARFKQR